MIVHGRAIERRTRGFSDVHDHTGDVREVVGESALVRDGAPVLGTWKQIVLVDHDNGPRRREVFVQVLGR